jgi:hypothetical protein
MHNEELHNLYLSSDITNDIKLMTMGGFESMGEVINPYKSLAGKSQGKGTLGGLKNK